MKKNKFLAMSLLALSMSSLLLTSCNEQEESGDVTIVNMWVHKNKTDDEGKVYETLKNQFNSLDVKSESGKSIRVTISYYGSTLSTKIQTSLRNGGLPDVIAIDSSDITSKASNNLIVPIDQYISDEVKSDYVDSVIKQSTIDNKLYALSGMDAPAGLYYNKDLLSSVGYSEKDYGTLDNPWSWKDVYNAMKALKKNNKPHQIALNLGFGDDGYMYLYSPLVYSAGGSFGTDDHVVETMLKDDKAYNGIAQLEQFFKTEEGSTTPWSYNGTNSQAFIDEVVPFQIYGPWDARKIEQKNSPIKNHYGIMPFPVYEDANGNKGEVVTPCGSYGFAVTKDSKHVSEAAKVVEYFTGTQASQMLFDAIGTFPTHKSLLNDNKIFNNAPMKALADYLIANKYTRPMMRKYSRLKDAYANILEHVNNMESISNYDLKKKIREEMEKVDLAR